MAHQSLPAASNLTSENGTARPESVDVSEAVALMADLGEAGEDDAEETASADADEGDDVVAEDGETAEEAADEEHAEPALAWLRETLPGVAAEIVP